MKKTILFITFLVMTVGAKAQLMYDNTKGWETSLEVGAYAGKNCDDDGASRKDKGFEITWAAGYNFTHNWYAGFATGAFLKVGGSNGYIDLIPVMGDVRYRVKTYRDWYPYVQLRGGMGMPINRNGQKNYIVANPSAGVMFRVSNGIDLRLSAGYLGLFSKNFQYKNVNGFTLSAGIGLHI